MTEIEKLKNSIRDMQSRPFGETFIQPLLYNILGDTKSDKNSYDALRNGKLRGEYKAIRLKAKKSNKKSNNMLEQILSNSLTIFLRSNSKHFFHIAGKERTARKIHLIGYFGDIKPLILQ